MKKPILTEKNCVIVLFVMVLVTFALAQEDSRKMEKAYQGAGIGMNILRNGADLPTSLTQQ